MNWIGESAQVPKQVWDKLNERKMDPLIRNRHYGKTHKPMNWIDEKIGEWKEYCEGAFSVNEFWIRKELQKAYDFGYSQAVIKTEKRLQEAHTKGTQEERERVLSWVKENFYHNGAYSVPPRVTSTDDLIDFITNKAV